MLKKHVILILLVSLLGNSFSQHGVAVGKWKSYFPFRNVIDVIKVGNLIYGATENGIIIVDYEDNSIEKLTIINALSDNGVSTLGYNKQTKTIIVGYSNGNIDLVVGNETINLGQIKTSSIIGDKEIYGIFCKNNFAYISTGFGIVVLDVTKQEVKDTYIIGAGGTQIKTNNVLINNGLIYATTSDGVYTANENNNFLADFNSWTKETNLPFPSKEYTEIAVFNANIIVNSIFSPKTSSTPRSDSVYILKNGSWGNYSITKDVPNFSFFVNDNKLIISQFDSILVIDTNHNIVETFTSYDPFRNVKANKVIYDGSHYFIADKDHAVIKLISNNNVIRSDINSIYSNSTMDIEIEDGQLWGATGSVVGSGWNKTYNNHGVFHYNIRENKWNLYNGVFQGFEFVNIDDFVGIAINPKTPKTGYGCSFSSKGILEFSNNKVLKKYDSSNSTMQISLTHSNRFAIADATFDEGQNLWAINSWSNNPLLVKTPNGTWKSFDCGASSKNKIGSKIMVDNENGFKWMVFEKNHLIVYKDNNTPLNETDDQYKKISSGASNGSLGALPTCVVEDIDGEIWIGTIAGFYVIYNPSEIFEPEGIEAQRVKIEQDGNVEYILGAESITSITIDGGNRKWIGTESSGIFVLSPDGITQIHHFTTENSPLISNSIFDIAIDHETGEVFVSTDKGLISYKGEATIGQLSFQNIYAFPNPVKPGYQGKIAITNLVENSKVHITDLAGNIVFATQSTGGQALWDGNNLAGARVSSGIYLVFVSGSEGRKSEATKILFMK